MIRLNDKDNSRINEKDINFYWSRDSRDEMDLHVITMGICGDIENLYYNNEQLRDKDIDLLDKIFDVKSIEYKAKAYPHEIDALKFAMSGIKQEWELVSEGEYDTVKKEEYLTWKDVEQSERLIKAKLPNGDIKLLCYDGGDIVIECDTYYREGCIYEEDLFNALMLKRVE